MSEVDASRQDVSFSSKSHSRVDLPQSLSVLRTNSHAGAAEVLLLDQAWKRAFANRLNERTLTTSAAVAAAASAHLSECRDIFSLSTPFTTRRHFRPSARHTSVQSDVPLAGWVYAAAALICTVVAKDRGTVWWLWRGWK